MAASRSIVPSCARLLVLLAGVALAPGGAHAYCRTTTEAPTAEQLLNQECVKEGFPLYWNDLEIHYGFDPTQGSETMDDALVRQVFAEAFESWAEATCEDGSPGLDFRQESEPLDEPAPSHTLNSANVNVMLFRQGQEWFTDPLHTPEQYALTSVWYLLDSGEIVGADMEINENKGPYTLCEESGCVDGYSDLLNIVTHEAGHVLGLAETYEEAPEATMYYSANDGELHKRSLHEDDVAGLCEIYAPSAQLERSKGDDDERGGCTVHRGPSLPYPLLGSSLFLALAFALRRLRRSLHA